MKPQSHHEERSPPAGRYAIALHVELQFSRVKLACDKLRMRNFIHSAQAIALPPRSCDTIMRAGAIARSLSICLEAKPTLIALGYPQT